MPLQTFDFNDGNGPVPAFRHLNPDGTLGGWVAATAAVAPTVYMAPTARVFGRALVRDHARLLDHACVRDYARVSGHVVLRDRAQLRDYASALGGTELGGQMCLDAWAIVAPPAAAVAGRLPRQA